MNRTFFNRLGAGIMAARQAFNQAFFMMDQSNGSTVYESTAARDMRYQMGQAFYEGDQWNKIHAFSQSYKLDRGLYKYIQNIYNPTAQIANFYKGVIWSGALDQEAADKGAIPIKIGKGTNETALRSAIATVWKYSEWNVNKGVPVIHGTVLGDFGIYIRDDIEHSQARIEAFHPSIVKSADFDARGFVKSYMIVEQRLDNDGKPALYKETAEHGEANNEIVFKTYRNDTPYSWDGNNGLSSWSEFYGFIPMVLGQHVREGFDWGRSEISQFMDKIAIIDDEASILHDKIRQALDPVILANFLPPESDDIDLETGNPTEDNPYPGREENKLISIDKDNASMTPVVVPLDIANVSANIRQMLDNLENDLPELRNDIQANVSEPTLQAARARVKNKVVERRSNYDSAIVRANQMAISIGGFRNYTGFTGFSIDSFKAGKLDHMVSERPIFPETENEKQTKRIAMWTTAADVYSKTQGIIPIETVLKDLGMTDEEMKDMPTQRMAQIAIQQQDTIPPTGL